MLIFKHDFILWIGIPRGSAMKFSFASAYTNNISVRTTTMFGEGKKGVKEEMTDLCFRQSQRDVFFTLYSSSDIQVISAKATNTDKG